MPTAWVWFPCVLGAAAEGNFGGRSFSVAFGLAPEAGYVRGMARHVDLGDPTAAFWESNSIEDHVSLMGRQVRRSLDDPETKKLARKIVNGVVDGTDSRGPYVTAWGKNYRSPGNVAASNDECAMILIWNFVVLNVQYVRDPDEYDLFCTVEKTLEAGVGDCDDATITLCTLLKAVGWRDTRARVISVDGKRWAHVYAMATTQRAGGQLIALDPTVRDATPGWEYGGARKTRDFLL